MAKKRRRKASGGSAAAKQTSCGEKAHHPARTRGQERRFKRHEEGEKGGPEDRQGSTGSEEESHGGSGQEKEESIQKESITAKEVGLPQGQQEGVRHASLPFFCAHIKCELEAYPAYSARTCATPCRREESR